MDILNKILLTKHVDQSPHERRKAAVYIYIVDVVPLMKTKGVVKNSGHCIYSIGLKCFLN